MNYFSLIFLVICVVSAVHGNEFDSDNEGHRNFNNAFENWRKSFLNKHTGYGASSFPWPNLHFIEPAFRELDASLPNGAPLDGVEPPREREPLDIDFISGTIGNPDEIETLSTVNRPPPSGLPQHPGYPPASDESTMLFNQGISSFIDQPFSQGFNGFPGFQFFNFRQNQPWWKGPNVCTEREEDLEENEKSGEVVHDTETGSYFSGINLNIESCVEKPNKHVCKRISNFGGNKKTITITHQCCNGFGRSRVQGMNFNVPCEKLNLRSLFETAENLGGKEFIKTAKNNDLDKSVVNKTMFLPSDQAFMEFAEQMFENNLVVLPISRQRRAVDPQSITSKDLIMGHMIDGLVNIENIQNEQLLKTEYENTTIRMNIFPRPPNQEDYDYPYRYTANCIPLTKVNQFTENGIIHMVQKVLQPTTSSILEIIRGRSDMTVFRTVLEKTKMDVFLEENQHLTVFAPTDKAFEKLSPIMRKKLKEGSACAANIIKNHILDLTFCSVAVVSDSHTITHNLLGEKIDMEIDQTKINKSETNELDDLAGGEITNIMINGIARLIETDIMGTNGVVHIIDTILPTDSGLPVSSALQTNNLTIFQKLVEASGLDDEFDGLMNVTFFVPNDKAFEVSSTGQYWTDQLEENADSLKGNAELKEFLEYHIAEPLTKTCDLSENMIKAKNGDNLRINLYTTHPVFVNIMNRATVNCARLIHFDDETCGSVVHQIDKVLESPKSTILEMLESNKDYSIFLKFINKANLTSLLKDDKSELTVFVPKDDVFREVQDWYTEILENPKDLENVIKSHIISDVLCCAGIVRSDWPFIRTVETVNNQQLKLNRDRRPLVQNAGVSKCDIIAKNGIIHEINDVIATNQHHHHHQAQQAQSSELRPNFFN